MAQKSITEPESCKTVKMFFSFFLSSFFFLLSSSDGLAQYCVNFSWWFTHTTAAFYTEQCTTLSLFITSKSHKALTTTHSKLWLPVWDAIFFTCTSTSLEHICTVIENFEDSVFRLSKVISNLLFPLHTV